MPSQQPIFTTPTPKRLRLPQALTKPRSIKKRSLTPKNPPKPLKSSNFRPIATFTRRTTFVQIATCLFLVSFSTVSSILFSADALAQRSLNSIAAEYYETYSYPRFTSAASTPEIRHILFQPHLDGFSPITLRTLLSFDNGRFAAQVPQFAHCDPITTTVTVIPYAPFEKNDYRLESILACSAK